MDKENGFNPDAEAGWLRNKPEYGAGNRNNYPNIAEIMFSVARRK